MKIVFGFVFMLNLFSLSVFAETRDDSYFGIRALSDNDPLKGDDLQIHLVVTDPMGKRKGYEPFPIPHYIHEFPGGYGTMRLGNEEDYEDVDNEILEFDYGRVLKGTYTITVYGLSSTQFSYGISMYDSNNVPNQPSNDFEGYISSGTTMDYKIYIDSTPGAPAPVISKEVTFDVLRGDVNVAYKLNKLGDEKFVKELIKIIDRAEKLSIKCDKKKKDKECGNKKASVNQLNSLIKRMEQALKKSAKEKGKKNKFITEEAFKIIKGDTEILIKDLGGKVKSKKDKKTKK